MRYKENPIFHFATVMALIIFTGIVGCMPTGDDASDRVELSSSLAKNERVVLNMNTHWLYSDKELSNGHLSNLDDSGFEQVSVPHANKILDKHLNIDVNEYRFISWYRRHFSLPDVTPGQRIFVEFQGVATVADIYVNGEYVDQHKGAYTSFTVDISDFVKLDDTNVIAVRVDSRRRPDVPPEGGRVDYALFGGIVRDVNMIITAPVYLADTFVTTPTANQQTATVKTQNTLNNTSDSEQTVLVAMRVKDKDGQVVTESDQTVKLAPNSETLVEIESEVIQQPQLWDIDSPYLYETEVSVSAAQGDIDRLDIPTGIRFFEFTDNYFSLNGRPIELFGLNRHEQWPWIGRAVANRLQAHDADVLKYELGNNIVRLSHYPQDPEFIQRADEIGLLLLEELPGWQHIGNEAWQEVAKHNLKEMILRDRNHPSIISWGVRLNESVDSNHFYRDTNALSLELDPTRPTHGVRTNENPEGDYQENGFYGYNDYNCWDGSTAVKEPKRYPWLITETNCYWKNVLPNAPDSEWVAHMKEFARIHGEANAHEKILGSIGWSYVDYNTEVDYNNTFKNFYSGVYDLFRLPRFSAGFYLSQSAPEKVGPVLDIASFWTKDSPTTVTITSNVEEIELFINGQSQGKKQATVYPDLDFPLFEFDVEFSPGELRAEGLINGEVVVTDIVNTPGQVAALKITPDFDSIVADGSDLTSVTVMAVDSEGNWVPDVSPEVSFNVSGAGKFIGENPIALENGRASFFVQSKLMQTGTISMQAVADDLDSASAEVEVTPFTQAIVDVPQNTEGDISPEEAKNIGGYLFATFVGEGTPMTEQVYFMLSEDGQHWEALNHEKPVLVSDVGEKGVRDPYIIRSKDNDKFYLIATDLSIHLNPDWGRAQTAASQSIVIWESTDLVNWTAPRLVKVAPDNAGCTWAPEAVYDAENDQYMVFWASKTADDDFAKHRIWAAHTEDFYTFSEPFVYIEKPNTVIDTTIIREHDTYYRFTKDEEHKAITMEHSKSLMADWQNVEDFSLEHLVGYEGPAVFEVETGDLDKQSAWNLLLDYYSKGEGYQTFTTSELSEGQFEAGKEMYFPIHPVRHGTVLSLSPEEYQRLKEADKNHLFSVKN